MPQLREQRKYESLKLSSLPMKRPAFKRLASALLWVGLIGSFPSLLLAADPSLNTSRLKICIENAQTYLDEKEPTAVSEKCFEEALKAASGHAIKKSPDGETRIVGYKNMIWIETKQTQPAETAPTALAVTSRKLIAGNHTELKTITALALDLKNQEVFILDSRRGLVLSFDLRYPGNVAPKRVLKNHRLIDATTLAVSADSQDLIIAHSKKSQILFFSRLADVEGKKDKNKTALLKTLSGDLTQINSAQDILVIPEHQELAILDQDKNQILFFNSTVSGSSAPKRVIRGQATRLESPVQMNYLVHSDQLEILNLSGSKLFFPRDSSGEVSPLNSENY